jgi:hypothetical protein
MKKLKNVGKKDWKLKNNWDFIRDTILISSGLAQYSAEVELVVELPRKHPFEDLFAEFKDILLFLLSEQTKSKCDWKPADVLSAKNTGSLNYYKN